MTLVLFPKVIFELNCQAIFDDIVSLLDDEIEEYYYEVVGKHRPLLVFRNDTDYTFLNHVVGWYREVLPCDSIALGLEDEK